MNFLVAPPTSRGAAANATFAFARASSSAGIAPGVAPPPRPMREEVIMVWIASVSAGVRIAFVRILSSASPPWPIRQYLRRESKEWMR